MYIVATRFTLSGFKSQEANGNFVPLTRVLVFHFQ